MSGKVKLDIVRREFDVYFDFANKLSYIEGDSFIYNINKNSSTNSKLYGKMDSGYIPQYSNENYGVLNFYGGEYIALRNIASFDASPTISVWIYITSYPTYPDVFVILCGDDGGSLFYIDYTGIIFCMGWLSSISLSINTWYNIVFSKEGLTINGEWDYGVVGSYSPPGFINAIGAEYADISPTLGPKNFFNGKISNIMIHNHQIFPLTGLLQTEINQNYGALKYRFQ